MSGEKVAVMAGGYGTRLKELGDRKPKGLIEFRNSNLITLVVDALNKLAYREIAVVTNAKYFNQYEEWNKSLPNQVSLLNDHTTAPENRLGALGDLIYTIEQMGWENENILVAPSDTYFEFSLKEFENKIAENPREFATIVREMDPEDIRNRLGCAVLSDNQKIVEFVEKPENPPAPYAAIPFYYLPAGFYKLLKRYAQEGNSMDAPGNIIPWLLRNNIPVNACIVTDKTIDVGTLKEVEQLSSLS